ncbi:hypothetical protein C8R47DRAFT_1218933 [Mycena vitilis]|nr:hypothetical protein C8R47DRAFT_1225086 [Mycena vitilis]KAJ6480006.1 hypothetical protein C8R47DRAFT_1218933 [Mycena vitilis]
MPDQGTQTDQSVIDELERGLKQEAIAYVEGRNTAAPSAAMLQWLAPNLLPHYPQPVQKLEAAAKEAEQLERLKRETLERMMRAREGWEERSKRPWLQFMRP